MKVTALTLLILVQFSCGTDNNQSKTAPNPEVPIASSSDIKEFKSHPKKDSIDFQLTYSYIGLGSNMATLQPLFTVNGLDYTYVLAQNSYFQKVTLKPQKICSGKITPDTRSTIIKLVKTIPDSLIYRTNPDIMSGGIYFMSIATDSIDVTFKLHNATHPIAQQIVQLLNSNIPEKVRALTIWND